MHFSICLLLNMYASLVLLVAVVITAERTADNLLLQLKELILERNKNPSDDVPAVVTTDAGTAGNLPLEIEDLISTNQKKRLNNHRDNLPNNVPGCQTDVTLMGIDYSMMGYNILYGYPLESGVDPGYRLPIFQKSFSQKLYTDDCEYLVPDGMSTLSTTSCLVTFKATECKDEAEYSKSLKNEVSAEFSGFGTEFSASHSYQKAVSEMKEFHSTYIVSKSACEYYYVALDTVDPAPLHSSFIEFLQKLQDSDNATTYFEFFDNFGTHFLTKSHVGARFTHEYRLTQQQANQVDQSSYSLALQAKYSSEFSLSGGASQSEEQKNAVDNFSKHSVSTTTTVGSVPPADGDAEQWASQVQDSPMPIQISLEPIYNIFKAQYFTGVSVDYVKIKTNVRKYAPAYCQYVQKERGLTDVCKTAGTRQQDRRIEEIKSNTVMDNDSGTGHSEEGTQNIEDAKKNSVMANGGVTGSGQDCSTQRTFTGMSYSTYGYNILYGYPMEIGLDPGFTRQIFNLTFSKEEYTPSCTYRIPDGFHVIPALSCETSFSADDVSNQRDISSSLEKMVSAEVGGWGVSFSASTTYQEKLKDMTDSKTSYIFSTATCGYYFSRIDPIFPPPLHHSFVTYLRDLQSTDDKNAYFHFFDEFGTHYIKDSYNGARYTHEYAQTIEQRQHSNQNTLTVSAQAKYASEITLSGGDKLTKEQQSASKDFIEHSATVTTTVGALPTVGGKAEEWASSVKASPMPMELKLGSIEEIFDSRFFKGTDIDYGKIKTMIQKYKPEYCKSIAGVESACNSEISCDLDGDGPHDKYCLRTWWLNAGCNRQGTASPYLNQTNVASWNARNGVQVRDDMLKYRTNADDGTAEKYAECFGITDGCPFDASPPIKQACLEWWWENIKCSPNGTQSPVNNYAVWKDSTAADARSFMNTQRSGPWLYAHFEGCLGGCPTNEPPYDGSCFPRLWEQLNCLPGGAKSPQNMSPEKLKQVMSISPFNLAADINLINHYALRDGDAAYELCFGRQQRV